MPSHPHTLSQVVEHGPLEFLFNSLSKQSSLQLIKSSAIANSVAKKRFVFIIEINLNIRRISINSKLL